MYSYSHVVYVLLKIRRIFGGFFAVFNSPGALPRTIVLKGYEFVNMITCQVRPRNKVKVYTSESP